MPSLISQPFVENAIWHGLSLKKKNRKLTVNVTKPNETLLQIEIIDNGIGRKKSEEIKQQKLLKRNSIGIKLSKERLKHFSANYENPSGIIITDLYENDNPIGTKVCIQIPLK